MKIAMFMDRFETGGDTTHIMALISALMKRGHQVLLYPAHASTRRIEWLKAESDSFEAILWGDDPAEDIAYFKPDLIHAHPFTAIKKGFEAAKELSVPLVITSHGLYPIGIDQGVGGQERCKHVQQIIAVDFSVVSCLSEQIACPEKIVMIPNGIDLDFFQPYSTDPGSKTDLNLNPEWLTLVFLGRLGDGKHHPLLQLFRVLDKVSSKNIGINLLIVGAGPYQTEVENAARKVIQSNSQVVIKMLGSQFDVRKYLAAADLVLACDRAALEAFACARPVLGAYSDGFKEIYTPRHYGNFLTRYQGVPALSDDELRDLLVKVANGGMNLTELGQDGRRLVEKYHNITDIALDHEIIYERSVQNFTPTA